MGRNVKKGLDYFPFDVDFFQDIKIRKLIKYQRGKAVTVYALLLCLIYKNGYYMLWDEELPFILSEQTGFEEAYIQEVVKCCLALGLFSKELFDKEKVLTSIGIQERYKRICDDCRRKCEFSEFNLISSEDKRISSEEKPKNSAESTQIKEKEIKEQKIPPQTPPNGVVSSDRGGRITSSPFSEKYFDIKAELRGKPGITENDVWEAMRLAENGKESSIGTGLIKQWLDNPSMCDFYIIIQNLQRMEREGQIRVMSHENYFVYVFLLMNLTKSDADSVRLYIQAPTLFEECKKLIAEIKKGGINQPGRFLLKKLRECQMSINKQNLK